MGGTRVKHIVGIDWLSSRLTDSNVRIIDCRFQLGNPTYGLTEYVEEHIIGALYFDLEKDLSGQVQTHGGRHPLPQLEEFVDKLSHAGIDHSKTVVAYDDQGGAFASRLWWLLKFLGHEEVYVLDGGFSAWKEQNFPVTNEIPAIERAVFNPIVNRNMLVEVSDVKEAIKQDSATIIDSREQVRFLGIEEPIDKVAGHIPSAVNAFWKDGIEANGHWKNESDQKERFSQVVNVDKDIIVYCGSGVTACPNILSLSEAGYNNVKLYSGSWSDWITYDDNPIAKG